ncbi:RNA polymerase sigma factor [Pseudonocardia lacus]|uniref:RNA polymerase sigma factor n=1 Tax=Pseudonocardia lacus TaxID=2835865 RepID=UPI001BDBCB90|nr:sigma-70 family RNA polymerase sigma factor [Pseudonocardia lacus]
MSTAGTGADRRVEGLLRELAPQVLGVLVRRYRQFDLCEDAVQEAMLAAVVQWPEQGVPDNPRGWLITVASRRLTDEVRSEHARRRREDTDAAMSAEAPAPAPDEQRATADDTLLMLALCCHPELSAPSQIALTLRAVGGLTTAEIAGAFLVPESTMAQRISRAKQKIPVTAADLGATAGAGFGDRLDAVLHVLYLIFNEGYTATSGAALQRSDLTAEAVRLARTVHRLLPATDPMAGEVAGLLALMLLTDSRRAARTDADGGLVPLAEQDRGRWDAAAIAEGTELVERAMASTPLGPYQLQAAIAAVHAEARTAEDTDWAQIDQLYRVLERVAPNPVVTLNRAVALAMVAGPGAGLDLLAGLDGDRRMAGNHRLDAVRAHLLELAGDPAAAREAYLRAARRTTSIPEQRYLTARAARLPTPSRTNLS